MVIASFIWSAEGSIAIWLALQRTLECEQYVLPATEAVAAAVCVGVWWCLNGREKKSGRQVDNRKKENKAIATDRWAKGGKLKHCNLLPS